MALVIAPVDPFAPEPRALVERHLGFALDMTPREHVYALSVDGVADPSVTLYGARQARGPLLAIGALRHLDDAHGEIKTMHTAAEARGQGVGRAMVRHLLGVARERGYRRVSLETGTGEAFAPARALYASVGFARCEPFGQYTDNPFSVCMTVSLDSEPE
jgi:putative acetyltransferase